MRTACVATFLRTVGFSLVLSCLLVPSSAAGQGARVAGLVKDPSGALLSGVRVEEKGTMSGTLTDAQGHFAFAVSSADATLVFSLSIPPSRTRRPRPADSGMPFRWGSPGRCILPS